MSAGDEIPPAELAKAFRRLSDWAHGEGHGEGSPFKSRLAEHFGRDPATFPVTREEVATYDIPNLQLAVDAYLEVADRTHTLVGFGGPVHHMELSLSALVHDYGFGVVEGPVRRTVVPLERGRSLTCITIGLFMISEGATRLAVLVAQGDRHMGTPELQLEVIAPEQEDAERFLVEIRGLMLKHNVYRAKVLALKAGRPEMMGSGMAVEFPELDRVSRDQIVLPDGVLDVVELHTVEFARHASALRASGRHLRRGLLLHGPPGTGKTLTTTHLISSLEGRTVVILTGPALGLIGDACTIARALQPAMVVLEDVDLVAPERTMGGGATPLLFQLLNEMDGIGEDADVIFLLTTNRADLLEPALAARPGRIDQAVEFPLPDPEARTRLLELFCRGLDVSLAEQDYVVAQTDGVSPAFLRELVRKAALQAARSGSATVRDEHFRAALELLEQGGSITRAMLGAGGGATAELELGGGWTGTWSGSGGGGDVAFDDG